MPTPLPQRQREPFDLAGLSLIVVPLCVLLLSTLLQGNGISTTTITRTLLLAGEAIARAEFALGYI